MIYDNYQSFIKFYKFFDDIINEKNDNCKVLLNNKQLSSKEYILVNLIDTYSILNELKFKKGTLLYEYYIEKLINIDPSFIDSLNNILYDINNSFRETLPFKTSLYVDFDITKIFSCGVNVEPIILDNKLIDILMEILNEVVGNKIDKKFIIFFNSDYININKIKFDNIISFDISEQFEFNNYNILLLDEPHNIFYDNVMEFCKRNWPVDYKNNEIELLVNKMKNYYFRFSEINTNNEKVLIISHLFNKYFKLNKNIKYNVHKIDQIILSFLQS